MLQSSSDDSRTIVHCCDISNCIDQGLNSSISGSSESENLNLISEDEPNRMKPEGSTNIQQSKWQTMYDQLIEFRSKYGHCLVPNRYRENQALGAWVSTQRRQYKILVSGSCASTPMTPERAAMLEAIGFVWATTDPRHVPWELRFRELCLFKKKHGTCLVPMGYKKNVKLANWVSTQRQEFKLLREGKTSRLTTERVNLLDSIGFIWEAHRGGLRIKKPKSPENNSNEIENPIEICDPRINFPDNRLGMLSQFQSTAIGSAINKRELGFQSVLPSRLIGSRMQSLMQSPGYFFSQHNQSESTLSGSHHMAINSNIQGTCLRQDDFRNPNSWNSGEDGNMSNCFDFPVRNISTLLSGRLNSNPLPFTFPKLHGAKRAAIFHGFQQQSLNRKLEESVQHRPVFPQFNAPEDQDSENGSRMVKRLKTQNIRRNEEFESTKVNGDTKLLRVPFTRDSIQRRNSCSKRFFPTEINLDTPGCIINVENTQVPVPSKTISISILHSMSLEADEINTKSLNNKISSSNSMPSEAADSDTKSPNDNCGLYESISLQSDEMDTKTHNDDCIPSESKSLQSDDMDTKTHNNGCSPSESVKADEMNSKTCTGLCDSSLSQCLQTDNLDTKSPDNTCSPSETKGPNDNFGSSAASTPFPNPHFGIFDDADEV